MSDKEGIVKSIFKFSVSTWITIFIGLLSSFIITRLFAPEVFGVVNLFSNAVTMVVYFVGLGLDESYIRFINEPPNDEKSNVFCGKLLFFITGTTCVALLIYITIGFDFFNNLLFGRVSWFLTLALFSAVYSNIILRFLNITYRMTFQTKKYTIQIILTQVCNKVLIILGALIRPSYQMIITFQVVGLLLLCGTYVFFQHRDVFPRQGEFSRGIIGYKGYGEVFRFALFSAPAQYIPNLNLLLTNRLVLWMRGERELGIYASTHLLESLFFAIRSGFSTYWLAYVYKNYASEKKRISQMVDYVVLVAGILFGAMVLFRDIIYMFIGAEYHEGKAFFSLVLIGTVLNFVDVSTSCGIAIQKKTHLQLINGIISVALLVVMLLVLLPKYGLVGAGYCVMISRVTYFIAQTIEGQILYPTILHKTKFIVSIFVIIGFAILPSTGLNVVLLNGILLFLLLFLILLYAKETVVIGKSIFRLVAGHRA